jgi:hypothetical protein
MKTSLKDYIDGLDLTPEEKAKFAPLLADEKVRGKIDAELSGAQSEISRKFDEAKAERERTLAYKQELAEWKAKADETYQRESQGFRRANETLAQYKARLKSFVDAGTLDEEDVKDLLAAEVSPAAAPTSQEPKRDPDTGKFLSREDFAKEARSFVEYPAQLIVLAEEHRSIFGTPMSDMDQIVRTAMQEGKKVREVWEEKYKVADKRAEIAALKAKEHDDLIRREERQKVTSELSNPASPVLRERLASPALQIKPRDEKYAVHQGQNQGVSAAVEAFNSGKYRGGTEKTA